jgi:DNA-binding response OmpR family regulator
MRARSARILLADDDPDIRALVTAALERAGHVVVQVTDGAQALASVQADMPDVAILDLSMPRLDGLEVLRRLRADDATSDLPVVLLSARAQEADVKLGFATGADAYVKKPFSPRELVGRIDALLG